ncbi:single-stranded DNA-binding protein [Streptomyces sp. NPDC002851]
MNETMVTVVGNVATKPVFRESPSGAMSTRFRLAVTARRFDRASGTWKDGHTNFFTVWAWRALAENLASAVSVGEPLIVQGRLKVRDESHGAQHWTSADIEALAVGHDMARGTSAFRRVTRTEPTAAPDGRPEPQFERPPETPPEGAAAAAPAEAVPPEVDVLQAEFTGSGPPDRTVTDQAAAH